MKNIHVLPTDKPSRLYIYKDKLNLIYSPNPNIKLENTWNELKEIFGDSHKPLNIYIISDDEIKVGDWYINTFVSEREQKPQTHTKTHQLINHKKDYRFKYCKKIILTTDQDLIQNGIQSILDEFLEWFVNNPICDSVELKPWFNEILSCCKSESECFCNKKRIVLSNNN